MIFFPALRIAVYIACTPHSGSHSLSHLKWLMKLKVLILLRFPIFFLLFLKGYIYSKKCIFLNLPLVSPLKQKIQTLNFVLSCPQYCSLSAVVFPLCQYRSSLFSITFPAPRPLQGSLWVLIGHTCRKEFVFKTTLLGWECNGLWCEVAVLFTEVPSRSHCSLQTWTLRKSKDSVLVLFCLNENSSQTS